MKRQCKNKNKYPNYTGKHREVTSVLRSEDGCMVFSEKNENGKIVYRKTNLKDLNIKPNKTGRRGFNSGRDLQLLKNNVVDYDYTGKLFMYCIHQEDQKLLPISEFSFNRTYPHMIVNQLRQSVQPFCKESKQKFVNGPSNKLRSSTQMREGSQGSRTRGLLTALCNETKMPTDEEIFQKFNSRCFKTGKILDINDRSSWQIDHLMPASGYNPLNYNTATLLSKDANQEKNDRHPLDFYGKKKLEKLCSILNFDIHQIDDINYVLNDKVLNYFSKNFEDVMIKWSQINRNKKSFSKYIIKEVARIEKKDIYGKHKELITKLKDYENKI